MARIRITRTLIFEGDEKWVRGSVSSDRTWLTPEREGLVGNNNRAYELPRKEEKLEEVANG